MTHNRNSTIIRPQRLLYDGLISSVTRHPQKSAIIIDGCHFTYEQLYKEAKALATALQAKNLDKGDRIAIYMENSWPCIVSIYAITMTGCVFLIVNPQTKIDKLVFILEDCGAKILICDTDIDNNLLDHLNTTNITTIITSKDIQTQGDYSHIQVESYDALIQETGSNLEIESRCIPNDLAALIYTSGSSGTPKGVMHSHQSMVFAAWSLIEYLRLSDEHVIHLTLPISFDYGLYQLLMAIKLGATLLVERSFIYPAQIYKNITDYQVSVFPGVPTIFALMIATHKKSKLSFPSVLRVTNTADALPPNYIPFLHEIFPNALIYKMYGQTECKRVSYLEPEFIDLKPKSVGRAIPGTEVFILSEDGKEVKPGEAGILYVRGPHVMLGYWNKPELSKFALKKGKLPGERVLCTNDYFRMDDEGDLYFVGRNDDIIKSRGEKVSPVEIINIILKMPGVNEVAVISLPDAILLKAITAFVVVDDNKGKITVNMIKKYCHQNMENYMVPKHIFILDDIPKTSNGKYNKPALISIATSLLEQQNV